MAERDGKQRAFDVWLHKAGKEGWSVIVESSSAGEPGDECGVVSIEGLRYRIHHGKRVRRPVAVVADGQHLVAAAANLLAGESDGASWTAEFAHAAWAEPIIDAHELNHVPAQDA
ncbi:hypothetical protein [Dactylosporangium sp. NPDC051541]|uniref:hypothetical protein n=1 Tax=Dactylosporangium sp. NPDC051541 TaxID=3363977 RepID=UPI0037AB1BB3